MRDPEAPGWSISITGGRQARMLAPSRLYEYFVRYCCRCVSVSLLHKHSETEVRQKETYHMYHRPVHKRSLECNWGEKGKKKKKEPGGDEEARFVFFSVGTPTPFQ